MDPSRRSDSEWQALLNEVRFKRFDEKKVKIQLQTAPQLLRHTVTLSPAANLHVSK